MPPEQEPAGDGLDGKPPALAGRDEDPIVVDLDEAVFEVLRRVETTMDPSDWIRAAVQEKAERDARTGGDVAGRLTDLLAEALRIVELEREFAGPEGVGPLRELTVHLRDAQARVMTMGSLLDDL
jgi:hypothetical protein